MSNEYYDGRDSKYSQSTMCVADFDDGESVAKNFEQNTQDSHNVRQIKKSIDGRQFWVIDPAHLHRCSHIKY